jgi:hypothetical protein
METIMAISELEKQLSEAQQRLKHAGVALSKEHKGGEWDEYNSAYSELLKSERLLAAAKGEAYCVPLEFPVKWDVGAPLPHLIRNDYKTFLTFLIHTLDPNWDGSYVTIKSPSDEFQQNLAIVEFHSCLSAKLGSPNDEVFSGHPLSGKGLESYTPQIVQNSLWIAELQAINSVHGMYNPANWTNLKHYVFWFHDTTFECIAESFTVELYEENMAQILARICNRLTN